MKKVIQIVAIYLIAIVALTSCHHKYGESIEEVIRDTIGKPTGKITQKDYDSITSLDLKRRMIRGLSGLEHLTNLTELDLSNTYIRDVTPLSNLKNLKVLHLKNNFFKDLTPLSKT